MLCTQLSVLSVVPFSVMPPPFAVVSVGDDIEPSSMFISSTVIVVALIVVVVPLTVKFPVTVNAPPTFKFSLIPTPPVTTRVPVVILVLAVFCVNVVAAFEVSVVNAPVFLVLAPILMLLIVPAVLGLIVIVPVPVGLNVTDAFAG